MYKSLFNKREVVRFKQFSNKGYSLFSCLRKEVIVCTLSVATIGNSKAAGVNIDSLSDINPKEPVKEIRLDDVEITGSRAPLMLGQAARMVTVLDREQIAQAPVQSINDLLKYAAGVDVRQRGAMGAQTDISVRGGTNEQITILLNGINICDPQTGHNAFDFPVDISEIERIEVLEGPAGRVYGTSSLVGAINIVTRVAKTSGGQVRLEGGSYGYLSGGGHGTWAHKQWSQQLSGSYSRSDGFSRSKAGNLNADYKGGKVFYQGQYDDPNLLVRWHAGISTKGFGSNTFYSMKFDEQYEKTMKTFTAIQAETKGKWFHFMPSVYWNHSTDRFELIRDGADKYPFNYHRTNVLGVNLNSYFDWKLGRTAFGAEFRNEDLVSGNLGEPLNNPIHIHGTDRDYDHGLNRSNISFFLEHNILLKNFTLSAGLTSVKNTWNEMSMRVYPGMDISYRVDDHWKLYASYNTSLRMPSFTELYYSVGGHKADKYLKPEELQALEAGVKYLSSAVSGSVSVYYHHSKNLIDWIMDTTEKDPIWKSVNHTKVNAIGVESNLSMDLQQIFKQQSVLQSWTISYNYINQKKDMPANIQSQYSLEYLRHKLVSSLQMQLLRNIHLNINYRFQDRTGSYTTVDGEVAEYKPYSLVDARLSWTLPSTEWYVEANNLFDKDYVDYGNVVQPGFWFIAGVRYRF